MRMIKNYSLRVFFTVLVLCMTPLLWAQERAISGKVVDQMGSPLPGVSIVIKGTSKGSITDLEGAYKLVVPGTNTVLVFSYVGYKPQEVAVGNQTSIGVTLQEDAAQLEEIVVIGYGSVKKEDLTGSVQSVNASSFNQGALTSPQELIVGKMPGVQVTTNGGAPGAGATIRIRGGSSLSASNDPLVVVDGVPLNDGAFNSTINPSDIETFTVLKDASSTAIYGSRASNGVILITTKRGAQGAMKIDYSGNASVASPIKVLDVLNATEYKKLFEEKFGKSHPAYKKLGNANTDWQKEIFETAISSEHNLAVSGSVKDMLPYRLSVGYNNANGILKTSNMERISTGLNLNPRFLDDHLKLDVAMKYSNTKNRYADTGAIGAALTMDPTQPVKAEGMSKYGGYYTWLDASARPIPIAPGNPVAILEQKNNNATENRLLGNITLDYKFHFLPELRANLNVGYDYSKREGNDNYANTGFDAAAFNNGGWNSLYTNENKNEVLDFYLNYNKDLPSLDSKLDVTTGYSWQHFWWENTNKSSYAKGEGGTNGTLQQRRGESYLVSFFGRANYTLKDRYLLTATLRADGSSRFAEANRWGYFPSFGAAWNIKKEDFMNDNKTVSALKLRMGYGVTGQQSVNEYGYMGIYTASRPFASYVYTKPDGTQVVMNTLRPEGYNSVRKWESTTTYNVALDYGFFADKLTGSIDVYQRNTSDLLNEIPVPAGSNLVNQLISNVGSLENKGIEFSTNIKLIQTAKLSWDFGVNATYNQNKITKLLNVEDPNYVGILNGDISGGTGNTIQIHSVGNAASSFYVYEQAYDKNGKPVEGAYVDRNGNGTLDAGDKYVAGQSAPKMMFGFNTRLVYGNWDFSASARAQAGNYVYNNAASNTSYLNRMQTNGEFLSNIGSDALNTGFVGTQYFSDYYVQKADFFRLDNATLGYNFKQMGKVQMRAYLTVNNAFVITNYEGIDPEVFNGIDNNFYPRPRTFLLGVNISL